jgi:hypothetical protein
MMTLEERERRAKKAIRGEGGFQRVPEVSAYLGAALTAKQSAIKLPFRAITKREVVWVRRLCYTAGYKLSLVGSEWVMRPFATQREKYGAEVLMENPWLSEGTPEWSAQVDKKEERALTLHPKP